MRRIDKIFWIPLVLFVMFCGTSSVQAQANAYKLQSLFIYNFIKNIKWENVDQEFVIGVYGNLEAYNEVVANLTAKNVNGVKFKILTVNNAADAKKCHVVYLPKSNRTKVVSMISQVDEPNILLVTEEDLISEGASISFELKDSKLNFIINKQKTEEKGLKISSSLLAMGTVI